MKEKACKGSSPQMLPKRTLLILPFIIINPPTQGCKLLPLLSIISTLQLGFKWHPPGSADTRMAKRVKMIFASLVADILFSSHFFLQWKPGHSLANRSPLVGPPLSHVSLDTSCCPSAGARQMVCIGRCTSSRLREIFETDLRAALAVAGGESQSAVQTHVLLRRMTETAQCQSFITDIVSNDQNRGWVGG